MGHHFYPMLFFSKRMKLDSNSTYRNLRLTKDGQPLFLSKGKDPVMLFDWNEQTLKWFREASDYTGYNRNMAALLHPFLEGCRSLCDIGCGMALVDLELAENFEHVLCVDVNETASGYVREQAEKLGHPDFRTVTADGMDRERIAPGTEPFSDAVMALFHGDVEKTGFQYLSYAAKKLIFVVHGSPHGSTGPEKYRVRKCCDIDHTRDWLEREGIPYTLQSAELEFGQPHRSIEEAIAYTRMFSKGAPEEELEAYVKAHVQETGRTDFPLYTQKTRKFGIFVIDAEQVRKNQTGGDRRSAI